MKKLPFSLVALIAAVSASAQTPQLSDYDVVWNTPSVDATGSMPIGNGEVVLNTWAESSTGDLMILIARTDALSEISRILKLGRIRIHLSGDPLLKKGFEQHLALRDGVITWKGGGDSLTLFVDSEANVIHVRGDFAIPRKVTTTLEDWREQARPLPDAEKGSAWSVHDAPFSLVESADVISEPARPDAVSWYHHNDTSVVPKLWENQSLTGLPGAFDPLLNRTFGGLMQGKGFHRESSHAITSGDEVRSLDLTIATDTAMSIPLWKSRINQALAASPSTTALLRTKRWWNAFWDRSYVYVGEKSITPTIPANQHTVRIGFDSGGGNRFPGKLENVIIRTQENGPAVSLKDASPTDYLSVEATITPDELKPGRIVDKLTAGQNDGFLFDTHPGNALRFIVGDLELSAPNCLKVGVRQKVSATYNSKTGEAFITLDGKRVASTPGVTGTSSLITRGYILQRYVQACQGRGEFPIKFNGGYFSVEPDAMGIRGSNPDFRKWGDAHWFQNVRHMYGPMLAMGDYDLMEPFFRLYERVKPLAEARTEKYHQAKGAYFPETMTVFGTYSGGDYGWNRGGKQPKDVESPWWRYAWNQGPELVLLMLDRWEYTRDVVFLNTQLKPMARSVLNYFDTRFPKDDQGKVLLTPTQVVETYWEDVVNDMPAVAGLNAITERLCALPDGTLTPDERAFFEKMRKAAPTLPVQKSAEGTELAPAAKYTKKTSNVENGELYAVWPFRMVTVSRPKLLEEAKLAYQHRKFKLDTGWGYDGNVAALLGLTDEAARILSVKARNSHPAYRWPATWGPNFDWIPDQNHGGNLLNTTNLMLLQADAISEGGAIRVLPAWPKTWDAHFKLRAPANTTVEVDYVAGKLTRIKVLPESRAQDIVLPSWLEGRFD